MKKKLMCLACAGAAALLLTACGGGKKEESVNVDMEALAKELLTTVTSDSSLTETAETQLTSRYFYDADAVEEALAYASAGTTACEIAIVKSKEASNTSAVEEAFQKRVDDQAVRCDSYNPPEAERLREDSIIESAGVYTVLCVCDDPDAAQGILEEYGF